MCGPAGSCDRVDDKKYYDKEPIIHSNISDCLPDDHPLALTGVDCDKCGVLVHAFNNENMQTWVETDQGNYCSECWRLMPVTECLEDNIDPSRSPIISQDDLNMMEQSIVKYPISSAEAAKIIMIAGRLQSEGFDIKKILYTAESGKRLFKTHCHSCGIDVGYNTDEKHNCICMICGSTIGQLDDYSGG